MGRAGTQHGRCFLVSVSCSVLTLRHNPPISYGYSIKIILEKWKDFSFECFYKHILIKHYNGLHQDIFTCVYNKYLDHIRPPPPSLVPPAILNDPLLPSQWDDSNVSPCPAHSSFEVLEMY